MKVNMTILQWGTSTSISLATGLAKARDLKKESGNVVAFIGDGSLSGGLAFEGLNNGGVYNPI